MFPASFDYYRAGSLAEAITLLGEHDGAKLLAGGHSLVPMMKLRLAQPAAVIDVGRVAELKGIHADGDSLRIGALTTHAEIASSNQVGRHCPVLAEAASKIGDPQVRNKGTIGGNIAHADPASDLPAVLCAVGATIHVRGAGGERSVAASDFFVGLLETALDDGEILTAVEVPVLGAGSGSAYLKFEHPASGYAVCGAAAVIKLDGAGKCTDAKLCFNGVTATPYCVNGLGAALRGSDLSDATIDAEVDAAVAIDEPLADLQASGVYRVALAHTFGKRALKVARDRARG
ncbi:MAG: xanthine dehydrogenase family protein subunit M [Thermoanaerobaculia bacterium]